jgi:D-3-phosphoglycerate dehydrogenase
VSVAAEPIAPARRIVVADSLHPSGLEALAAGGQAVQVVEPADGAGLDELLGACEALIVGTETRVDAALLDAAPALRVIGCAGDRADDIDVAAATRRGVMVIRVPSDSTIAVAEHSFAMLLALARDLAGADASLKAGGWDRGGRFGTEVYGKVLGVIGLGRVGREVAARARAFGMSVLAHDPFLDPQAPEPPGVRLVGLPELLAASDAVSLHARLDDSTSGLLDAGALARLKPGALLVNCAGAGLVDEAALLDALDDGRLGGAALDVFVGEPAPNPRLVRHPRVLATPHLAARTHEARQRASVEVARRVLAALSGSLEVEAVNLPSRSRGAHSPARVELAEKLGRLATALLEGPLRSLEVTLWGSDADDDEMLALAATRGALGVAMSGAVNYVNAADSAAERGIEVVRRVHAGIGQFSRQVVVSASGASEVVELTGAIFAESRLRVVRIGRIPLEFRPQGLLLILRTFDVPGVVGTLGTLLGGAGINIADIHLARKDGEEDAWTVLRLDEKPPADLLARLRALPAVRKVWLVDLDPFPTP